jgi:hypothetical protein
MTARATPHPRNPNLALACHTDGVRSSDLGSRGLFGKDAIDVTNTKHQPTNQPTTAGNKWKEVDRIVRPCINKQQWTSFIAAFLSFTLFLGSCLAQYNICNAGCQSFKFGSD